MPWSRVMNWPSFTTLAMKSPRMRVIMSRSSRKLAGITCSVMNATSEAAITAISANGLISMRGEMPEALITISSESLLSLFSV